MIFFYQRIRTGNRGNYTGRKKKEWAISDIGRFYQKMLSYHQQEIVGRIDQGRSIG